MVDFGGNMHKSMLAAGYSEAMANNPQKLTRSRGWQELIDKFIGEDRLIKIHKQMLDSVKLMNLPFDPDMDDYDIRKVISKVKGAKFVMTSNNHKVKICSYTMPDGRTQLSALDMAYKIRGKYQVDNEEQKINVAMETALERINRLLPGAEL